MNGICHMGKCGDGITGTGSSTCKGMSVQGMFGNYKQLSTASTSNECMFGVREDRDEGGPDHGWPGTFASKELRFDFVGDRKPLKKAGMECIIIFRG